MNIIIPYNQVMKNLSKCDKCIYVHVYAFGCMSCACVSVYIQILWNTMKTLHLSMDFYEFLSTDISLLKTNTKCYWHHYIIKNGRVKFLYLFIHISILFYLLVGILLTQWIQTAWNACHAYCNFGLLSVFTHRRFHKC